MQSDTVSRNLSASSAESARLSARRAFYLADQANETARALAPRLKAGEGLSDLPLGGEGLSPKELVLYGSLLYRALSVSEGTLLSYHSGGSRIAYMRQSYADAAYTLFSDLLDGATVSYTDSSRAAAEEVFSEVADFCILPYSDREGSTVRASRTVTETLGLRLVGRASVGAGDLGALTYALYGRALLPPQTDTVLIDLRLPAISPHALACLAAASERVGAAVLELGGDNAASVLHASLKVRRSELAHLTFIFEVSLPGTDVVGLSDADD